MEQNAIKAHWENWAQIYKDSLRATTKSPTPKMVEIHTFVRAIRKVMENTGRTTLNILEAGCGHGRNCLSLLEHFPDCTFSGFDFVPEMIESAKTLREQRTISPEKVHFSVGNVLYPDFKPESFDVIFTNRCLINLNSDALQHEAIGKLAGLLKTGGTLLMLENSMASYTNQNKAREAVGLEARTPAEFNHFLNEDTLFPALEATGLPCEDVEDCISLHDLVLYVLLPMVNNGQIVYDDPLVEAAARLNIALSDIHPSSTGIYGQNRLYVCKKI